MPRRINFVQTTDEELQHLAESCDVATFGVKNENVHDESYRKAGKLNTEHFSVGFDPMGTGLIDVIQTELMEKDRDSPSIRAERYKLNVYGKSQTAQLSFKLANPCVDRQDRAPSSKHIKIPLAALTCSALSL